MSDSSQQKKSIDDLPNDILIDLGGTGVSSDCITITLPDANMSTASNYYISSDDTINVSGSTITLTGAGASTTYTLGPNNDIIGGNFANEWQWGEEFVDKLPDLERIKDMCSKYPGLEIAFRNFETIYKLVKDDYDNPTPKK